MREPINLNEARAHAANYRVELSRLGLTTPMLIEALIAEIEQLRAARRGTPDVEMLTILRQTLTSLEYWYRRASGENRTFPDATAESVIGRARDILAKASWLGMRAADEA